MSRYSIVKVKENLLCIFEWGEIICSSATLDAANSRVERLEYQDLMKEMMTYQ